MELIITEPDDFHHHLRDGPALKDVTEFAAKNFGRVVAMPNTRPPIRSVSDAIDYKKNILNCITTGGDFQPLMTLYLTNTTTVEDIIAAKESGIVHAVKLYPAGATTNSEYGVTDIGAIKPVLQKMAEVGLLLLVHGEVTDSAVDIFDREKVFIERVLFPIIQQHPNLKVVMEHITTEDAVNFVRSCGSNVAATITAHHLLYNRNDIFKGGVCPHMYCLPILKREHHRLALVEAATSGNPKFFIGTDSAPHSVESKESACGCAGIFTGHAPIELYAEAFETANALDKLENFTSLFGQQFYGLPPSTKKIMLVKESWTVPLTYNFGGSVVRPLRAGEQIHWKRIHN